MPKLDVRLQTVASQIRSATHVDIGSDHGGLLVSLLQSGRIDRGIAIENKRQPYENSCRALARLAADVRFGEGLAVLEPEEAESLSICGMGAERIVKILQAFPTRIPSWVVLQPNRQPELIRQWALRNGFHLKDEQIARCHWPYVIMSFRRAGNSHDPAYQHVDQEAALLFGPLILKRRDSKFQDQLREEQEYLSGFARLTPGRTERLRLIRKVLATMACDGSGEKTV